MPALSRPPSHDWEEVRLEPETSLSSEFELPSREDPSLSVHVVLKGVLNWTYVRSVGVREDGYPRFGPVNSLRRCRACRQESVNGEEPEEPCGPRQVRRVMSE